MIDLTGVSGRHMRGPGPTTSPPSPHLVESQTVNLTLQNHGSLPRKGFKAPYYARVWPCQCEATSSRPTIKAPRISCTSNQPQYEFSCYFSELNVNSFYLAVFELPEELILLILSHIAPDTQYTAHWMRFRILHELKINDPHQQRVRLLRPLSMTCKAMRLRLVPWIWECLEFPPVYSRESGDTLARKHRIIAKVLHVNILLATSVKYFCFLLCPYVAADSRPLKVHDNRSRVV